MHQEHLNHNFQSNYFFDTWQKKIIFIQPEMIIWLLVRNFFRQLQKKYQVKSWFREDKICLTGQSLDNINLAHKEILEASKTHTMDFIWRSEDNDQLMDRVFSGFSVNQDYEQLLVKYPLLLVIKRQKFRKVSLWLKNNGYSGLDNIYPVLPSQFVMIFAPKKEKEIIMEEISRISNNIKQLLSNHITPGEETYFDLKGFSNFQIKKSFIYSSRVHVLDSIKTLTFCLDFDIKFFQEKFNVYLDFKVHPLDKDKIYLRIHAVRDLDIFIAEENLLGFFDQRMTVMVDLEQATQDEMMNNISSYFLKSQNTTKFFKSSQLTQMANAFDQFYQTSMLESLTAMENYSIPKLVIALDERDLAKTQARINEFFETKQPLQQFDFLFKSKRQLQQAYVQPFETPTSGNADNEQQSYLGKKANYLCHQVDERVIDIIFYNYEGLRFKNFIFDLVDFSHYIQKHYRHPEQVTPTSYTNKLSFKVKFTEENFDIEVMQILDKYINYELIFLQKQKLTQQLIALIKELEVNYWCDCELNFINFMSERNVYYPEEPEYDELWNEIKKMNKGTKVCVVKVSNLGHSQKNRFVKSLIHVFSQCK